MNPPHAPPSHPSRPRGWVRTFSLEDARALVPVLVGAFARTTQLITERRLALEVLIEEGVLGAEGPVPRPDEVPADLLPTLAVAGSVDALVEAELRRLSRLGVDVREVLRGHVDLPTVLDGQREVVLCWCLGDRTVAHFHEVGGDLASRRAIGEHRFFERRQLGSPQR
ncbi:MAG: DUF2203 family protein [Sandaracinaceae bacterium]